MQRTMTIESCNNYFRVRTCDLNAIHSSIKVGPFKYHVSGLHFSSFYLKLLISQSKFSGTRKFIFKYQ